jgi:hypothetical protein
LFVILKLQKKSLHTFLVQYHLFQYNKKQSTLFAFVYYNYGNSELLQESSIFKALTKVEPYLNIEDEGCFFATLDSLNFGDFITEKHIENGIWTDYNFSQKEINEVWKEVRKKFFDKIEDVSDYATFFNENRNFIDKEILNNFEIIREKARVKTVREALPKANSLNPIQIFKGYFYNGNQFYYCDGRDKIVYLENINLQNLEETSYGLTDGTHIIIGEKVIKANPKTFKKLHKFYTTFYKTDTEVFDGNLDKIDEADAKSFKLTTYKRDIADLYYGEDSTNIYFLGEIIPKEELGDFSFSNALFYNETLLIGTKKIYLGATFLDEIDAASFEKLPLKNIETYELVKNQYSSNDSYASTMNEFFTYGKDKHGELFIFKPFTSATADYFVATSFGFKNSQIVVLRLNPVAFWEFYTQYKKEVFENALPFFQSTLPEDNTNTLEFYNEFNAYFESSHFDKLFTEHKYSIDFLTKFNNYLHNCWQLFIHSKNKDLHFLITGLSNYKKVKAHFTAELNPYIFHHLACFSVALHQLDEAVNYVLNAFYYGYLQFHLILTDEDLEPIFNNSKFVEIKNWYDQNIPTPYTENQDWRWHPNLSPFPRINQLNLDLIDQLPEENKKGAKYTYHQIDYVSYIMNNYFIWDFLEENDENSKAYNELISKFEPYFNSFLQNTMDLSWQEHCAYLYYQNYTITNAKSHLVRLEYLFYSAHNEYGINEMTEELVNDLMNRIKLKLPGASEEDKEYINTSKIWNFLQINHG